VPLEFADGEGIHWSGHGIIVQDALNGINEHTLTVESVFL
jgi:hypothetical protein